MDGQLYFVFTFHLKSNFIKLSHLCTNMIFKDIKISRITHHNAGLLGSLELLFLNLHLKSPPRPKSGASLFNYCINNVEKHLADFTIQKQRHTKGYWRTDCPRVNPIWNLTSREVNRKVFAHHPSVLHIIYLEFQKSVCVKKNKREPRKQSSYDHMLDCCTFPWEQHLVHIATSSNFESQSCLFIKPIFRVKTNIQVQWESYRQTNCSH